MGSSSGGKKKYVNFRNRQRASLSFFIVVMFFGVFGIIVFTEIFFIDERSRAAGVVVRRGSLMIQHKQDKSPDYEDGFQSEDYISIRVGAAMMNDDTLGALLIGGRPPVALPVIEHSAPSASKTFAENQLPPYPENTTLNEGAWQNVNNSKKIKMIFPIIFAVVISTVNALTVQEQWTQFKDKHGKIYKTIIEEKYRFEIFQNNLKTINEHNAKYEDGLKTYQMGVNQFADLTSLEFGALFNRQIGERPTIHESLHVQSGTAPDSIDWREKNAVLEVKNQGSCGSCWAFSATGSIEGQNVLINNKSVSLSEQQLVDCTKEYGNYGCDGGWMENSFKFVIENGLVAEKDYPYTARQGQCKKPTTDSITIKGYKKIPQSEAALKDAVGTVGPISVLIYGDYLRFYKQGIFYEVGCVSDESYLDHAVLIVGYGIYQDEDNKGEKYWLVKNSWGKE